MIKTLQDLIVEAENRLKAGNLVASMKIYRLLLESIPLDFTLRFKIADILMNSKHNGAVAIYQGIVLHCIKSGDPLRALVAIKILESIGLKTAPQIEMLAKKYCAQSTVLGRGIKLAPTNYKMKVREDLDLDYQMKDKQVIDSAAQMAAFIDNIERYPDILPPLSIFSTLDFESFIKLASALKLIRFNDKETIVKQGREGDSLYFIARGEVKVVKKVIKDGEKKEIQLAKLGAGSLFGEMALVSSSPRGASVVSLGDVDVLELNKEMVKQLSEQIPNIAGAIARFTKERLILNLFATNPIFEFFDNDSKKQLLAKFTGHEVPQKTIYVEQGKPGVGLYLILQGQSEVLKWNGSEYIKIADLSSGDIVGEISLIHEVPAMATVRTVTNGTLLFLAKELFYPLVEAIPGLLVHFAKMAESRIEDAEIKMKENMYLRDDFIESINDCDDLDSDDLICI